ncbi:hypothetical protein CH063_12405, partial [Colletotrichum higginsianum]
PETRVQWHSSALLCVPLVGDPSRLRCAWGHSDRVLSQAERACLRHSQVSIRLCGTVLCFLQQGKGGREKRKKRVRLKKGRNRERRTRGRASVFRTVAFLFPPWRLQWSGRTAHLHAGSHTEKGGLLMGHSPRAGEEFPPISLRAGGYYFPLLLLPVHSSVEIFVWTRAVFWREI